VPFNFEGRKRRIQAEEGLEEMRENVDTLLVINNERLREITGNLSITNAFEQADDILATAARGIAEVIAVTGAINVDFNDVNTVMRNSGVAIMGSAAAEGENRALKAVEQSLESPLLNDNDISGAEYVLLNITYGEKEVTMDEITEITDFIQDAAGSTADVIFGHAKDEDLGDKLSVTVIATGFKSSPITGFEKAPKRNVTTLEDEKKSEVTKEMSSPTERNANVWAGAKEVTEEQDEPFLKSTVSEDKTASQETEEKEEPAQMDFGWNVTPTQEAKAEETEVKRYTLEDDMDEMELDNTEAKKAISPEEQQKRTKERLSKIQEYTQRLKKADGLQDLENEPAYVRRNVQLDDTTPSEESPKSRFSVSKDEEGTSLNSNNSFLHDNVD
jgi:cell division protein FtsZ